MGIPLKCVEGDRGGLGMEEERGEACECVSDGYGMGIGIEDIHEIM